MPIRTNRGRAAVYRKLWGWPMRSPSHLVAVVLVVAAVVLTIGIVVPRLTGSGGDRSGAAAQTTESTTAATGGAGTSEDGGTSAGTGGSADGSATSSLPTRLPSPPQKPTSAPPADDALKVATAWGKAWVNHPTGTTTDKWLDGLRPYTTDEYLVEMSTVDPANIPATKVTGPPVPKQSYTSSLTANLPTDGGTLAITVIDTPQGWRVAFYEQVA
ncbi:MAG TPA: hypothetical protein VH969_28810 [Actinophytocola sp.]|jgi:hypothetical protein|uniref:hypothetical protein n=1 Tax=Actinophytocola sp. TaxID=1872138 RepID=UPI002F951105